MQNKIIAIGLCLSIVVSTPAFAQPLNSYDGSKQVHGEPQTTNQDLASKTLDALLTFFASVLKIGNSQDQHLQQIIKNQQTEIQLLQKIDKDLTCLKKIVC